MSDPGSPLPVILLSPSVTLFTSGVLDFSDAGTGFSFTVALAGSDGSFPSSVWTTLITSSLLSGLSAGTSISQFLFSSTLPGTFVPSGNSTTISDPGSPLPVILSSPSVTLFTSGVFDFSSSGITTSLALAVIVVFFVIATSLGLAVASLSSLKYQPGFSKPSFALPAKSTNLSAESLPFGATAYVVFVTVPSTIELSSCWTVTLNQPAGIGSFSPTLSSLLMKLATYGCSAWASANSGVHTVNP